MPSTSAKQAKFMRAVAHSPKFAKKVGVPQSVGKDFEMADKKKMKKFASAGQVGRRATEQAMTGVEDILKSAPALVAAAQSDKTAESALKSAVAPQKAPSFAEAFRAARAKAIKEGRDPSKETFMWGGEKKVARMASEGPGRPATTTASRRSGTGSTTPTSSATSASGSAPTQTRPRTAPDWTSSPKAAAALAAARSRNGTSDALLESVKRRNKLTPAAPKPGLLERYTQYMLENTKSPNPAEIRARLKTAAAQKKAAEEAKQRRASEEARKVAREYERRTGKSLLMKAKGGSVDGCAVRGKTRAPMRKGK